MAAMNWVQLLPADDWFVVIRCGPGEDEPLTVRRIVAWGLGVQGNVEPLVVGLSRDGTEGGSVVEPVREAGVFYKHLDALNIAERELAGLPMKGVPLGH